MLYMSPVSLIFHTLNTFKSWLRFNLVVVQYWYQSVPVRSKHSWPFSTINRGQTLGTHWSCPTFPLHISFASLRFNVSFEKLLFIKNQKVKLFLVTTILWVRWLYQKIYLGSVFGVPAVFQYHAPNFFFIFFLSGVRAVISGLVQGL